LAKLLTQGLPLGLESPQPGTVANQLSAVSGAKKFWIVNFMTCNGKGSKTSCFTCLQMRRSAVSLSGHFIKGAAQAKSLRGILHAQSTLLRFFQSVKKYYL